MAPWQRPFRREIHIYHHIDDDVVARIVRLFTQEIRKMAGEVQQELNRLGEQVARNTTVTGSATELLGRLAEMIRENADNPEEVRALADQLTSTTDALAAAVAANTPQQPAPPPTE